MKKIRNLILECDDCKESFEEIKKSCYKITVKNELAQNGILYDQNYNIITLERLQNIERKNCFNNSKNNLSYICKKHNEEKTNLILLKRKSEQIDSIIDNININFKN